MIQNSRARLQKTAQLSSLYRDVHAAVQTRNRDEAFWTREYALSRTPLSQRTLQTNRASDLLYPSPRLQDVREVQISHHSQMTPAETVYGYRTIQASYCQKMIQNGPRTQKYSLKIDLSYDYF